MLRNEQDEHPSDADVSVHLASQWGQPIEERSEAEILSSSESDRSYEPLYSDERQRSGMLESDQREREANGRVSEQGSIVHGGPDAFDLADEGLSQLGERSTLGDELETASDSGDSMLTVSGASSIVRPTVLATLAAASALIRPTVITSCSGCNTPFNSDSLRYVCDVCGPGVAVPEQDALDGTGNGSPSERTEEAGSNEEESEDARSEPASETSTNPEDGSSTAAISLDETTSPPSSRGFELCFSCLDSHGKTHAAATGLQTLDGGAQTVPRIQHAFRELMWEGGEWKPVGECRGRDRGGLSPPNWRL